VLEKLKPAMEFFRPALRRSSRYATKLRSEVQATDEIITIESSEDDESEREVYEEKVNFLPHKSINFLLEDCLMLLC